MLATLISVVLHVLVGWQWSIIGGIVYGYWGTIKEGGSGVVLTGILGAFSVGSAWMALVVYNYIVARDSIALMLDVMGGIMGNLPGSLIVVVTLLIGFILGFLGALIGRQIKSLT